MIRGSLSLRLALAAGIVLLAFLGLTGIALEKAFRDAAHKAMEDRLQAHIYALLATFDIDSNGQVSMAEHLLDSRFSRPGSGLYGFVFMYGQPLWRSPSALGLQLPPMDLGSGKQHFTLWQGPQDLWVLYYSVIWETETGHRIPLVLAVAEDAESLARQVANFRRTLWSWLGGLAILLLSAQFWILRWGLKPLRTIADDLEAIEAGHKQRLQGPYPKELAGLAINLNALLDSERAHLERYRNTLADLAHSLKTPLAILRGLGQQEDLPGPVRSNLEEQVERMQHLVDYQLQKAAARGRRDTLQPVALMPALERIRNTLDKVYAGKGVHCTIEGNPELQCYLDEGDLYELAGNLLDNAYKWCRRQVHVGIKPLESPDRPAGISLAVEDDGPGIPEAQRGEVLKRGIRADRSTQGHGIGLAIVHELISLHSGRLNYRVSRWGGACWEVILPIPGETG
ncbi:MAG TPA: sensor histidine kinase [Methylothermaceae bacterium]|nr:sensor histidine kinase [Methylothermaceae bacterium]